MKTKIAVSIVFIFILFSSALSFNFFDIDDGIYINNNINIKNGLTKETINWAFTSLFYGNWSPITWLSHALDVEFFGLSASYHHLTSIILHILNFILLYLLLTKLKLNEFLTFAVSILFAIHPVTVETVVWISSRKELLTTFFCLLTLNTYLNKKFYIFSIVFYFLALASKISAITLLFPILVIEFLNNKKVTRTIPFIILSTLCFIINLQAQKYSNGIVYISDREGLKVILLAIKHLFEYIQILILPGLGYSNIYPQENFDYKVSYLYILVPISVLSLLYYLFKKKNYLGIFGLLFFISSVFPYLQFIPVGFQSLAHRWIYQAQIGIYIFILSFLTNYKYKNYLAILLIPISLFTINEVSYFDGSKAFYRVRENFPNNATTYQQLISVAFREDKFYKIKDIIKDAQSNNVPLEIVFSAALSKEFIQIDLVKSIIESYLSVQEVPVEQIIARIDCLNFYGELFKKDVSKEALEYIDIGLKKEPELYLLIKRKGLTLQKKNDPDALSWLLKTYKINPFDTELLNTIGTYYANNKDYENAKKYFIESLNSNPFSQARLLLSQIYNYENKYQQACDLLSPKIRIGGNFDEYLEFAKCQYYLENKSFALKLLEFSSTKNPKDFRPYINGINMSLELGLCSRIPGKLGSLKKLGFKDLEQLNNQAKNCISKE